MEALEGRELLSGEPWGAQAKLIGQDLAAANYPTLTGAGQTIAIIDSGVDYNHPALGGGIGSSYKVIAGYDFASYDADPMSDTFAHGTGAAGIAAADAYVYKGYRYQGIAPDANIVALRENGTSGVKAALEWVLANRVKYNIVAVNMTDFGGGSATTYRDVLKSLINAGVFVSHPSGNGGASVAVGGALDPADFAVGSVNLAGQVSSFTQRGAELDLLAPGEKVTLPYYDVATKRHIYVDTADGTSWASPAAVGAAALIKQIDPRFTPAQIMKIMQDSGRAVYDAATNLTYKRLDLNAALSLAYQRRAGIPQPTESTGPVTAPAAEAQSPYTPVVVGGVTTIQAEEFDHGGEGVAFHDADSANVGGSTYRTGSGVDVQTGAGGGRYVGFVRAGEWLEYSVTVTAAGTFDVAARVASLRAGGTFHVEVDGVDRTGTLSVPNTSAWEGWTTVGKAGVTLSAGSHVIRIKADTAGALGYVANFDSITVTPAQSGPAGYDATAFSAQGGVTSNAGYVGSLDQGDWVAYRGFDFGEGASTFTASVAAANGWGGKSIQLRLDSPTGAVIGTLTVPSTGGWTTFRTVNVAISQVTHVHDLYFTFAGGDGTGNVAWFKFS
jgi:subtilisin family serine protease